MIYGFDTERNENAALGALLVYGLWRSRDMKKFKITPEVWGQVSRAVSGCAFRSVDLWEFIEKMKPKLQVAELKPKWMRTDNPVISMFIDHDTGEIIQRGQQESKRQFWTDILETADHEAVLNALSKKTSLVVALVRDRLERERPYEVELEAVPDEVIDVAAED
ncbi:MAG: hypothetical protein DDT29_01286 [Dehalococcoidia bacterium]|nr:hypothetical protein [Bacillota bacterium]